jgi:methylenetetrahydrofolate reductase (NADPH)
MKLSFQEQIQAGDSFPIGAEIVTSRGISALKSDSLFGIARNLLSDDRIAWISVTDNPGGIPMLPPDWLTGHLAEFVPNIILHLTCKDLNRSGLESNLWRYAAEGFNNILALSGDLPTISYPKLASGVFDIDSVALLEMISAMNRGFKIPLRRGVTETLAPTTFFPGCVVNPFKVNENELVPQYYKLVRKIRAGAAWVLPQLGYDMRKFHEVRLFLESQKLNVPIIGNVFVLTKTVAKMFNRGQLAGCAVSDQLLENIEKYASGTDKGKKYFQEFAAKQLAVFKGLGFTAGYLGGLAKPESFFEIIETVNQFADGDWKTFYQELQFSQPNEFYFFNTDFSSELNPVLKKPARTKNITLFYRFSRLVHATAFHRGYGLYPLLKRIFQFLNKNNSFCHGCHGILHWIEKDAKHTLYGCSDCGDCGLPDTAYLCPMNKCSKNMRNGPCGGSAKSRCEADDKDCIWTIAYDRLKYFNELEHFKNAPVIIYDAELKGTSAWSNLYLDRDHASAFK